MMIPGIFAQKRTAQPVPWTPEYLHTPAKLWLDSSSPVSAVSGLASQWNDQSPNAWHVSQPTDASRPAILNGSLNGLRTLDFDGSNDRLRNISTEARGLFQGISYGWIFMVVKPEVGVPPIDGYVLWANVGNANRSRATIAQGTDGRFYIGGRRADSDSYAGVIDTATMPIAGNWVICRGRINWADNSADIATNGKDSILAGGLWGSGGGTATTPSQTDISIGANTSLGGAFSGEIAVVICGSGSTQLSDIDAQRLEGWAAHKYGLTVYLPDGHPYKIEPPYR